MGYGRAAGRKKSAAALFPAEQNTLGPTLTMAVRGGAPRPSGEPARPPVVAPASNQAGRGARRTAHREAANDPLDSTIYCRLGELVIATVTAFARHLKTLHGPRVAFDRSPGYWLVRQFGLPVARYHVEATGSGLTFERVPFSKRQRAELRSS